MAFTKITNRDDLKKYIAIKLGAPINNVELSDEQYEVNIDDAINFIWKYAIDVGSFLHYYKMNFYAGVGEYCLKDLGILGVYQVSLNDMWGNLNVLFSPENMYIQNFLLGGTNNIGALFNGGTASPYGIADNSGLEMSGWESVGEYMKLFEQKFGKMYTGQWRQGAEVLTINPAPKQSCTGVVALYTKEDEENLFNDEKFRELIVAMCAVQLWPINLGKNTGNFPDGLQLRIDANAVRWDNKLEAVKKAIRDEASPPDFFIG